MVLFKSSWFSSPLFTSYKKGKVTIPKHSGDLKRKTVLSILKQAGLR